MLLFDRRDALRASLYGLSSQAFPASPSAAAPGQGKSDPQNISSWVSVFDRQFAGGAKGDGVTDDTKAIAAAAVAAATKGMLLYMPGSFAVANLKLPGRIGFLHVFGDPVFIQARADTPCLVIQDQPLQQALGCRMTCTVIPHPASSKTNPSNVAINLTGFSSSEIIVRLGRATRHDATTGRFHTVIYADAGLPFHYGNRIRLIANAVPAPHYGIRYANRGKGAAGNPNINMLSAWFNALDTQSEDVLIDVADTTQTIIEGPTLIEACPHATAIRAGNFTTIRDIWFEQVGTTLSFLPTRDTSSNNCRVERCYFSGAGHIALISTNLAAPPSFLDCLGTITVNRVDQTGKTSTLALELRSPIQPAAPEISFTQGSVIGKPDQAELSRRSDHHGRTTYQLRYFVQPAATGVATMRVVPPVNHAIEHITIGLRDADGRSLAWGLGDDLAGRDYNWVWMDTRTHILNIRVTLFTTE